MANRVKRIARTWEGVPSHIRSQVFELLEQEAQQARNRAKEYDKVHDTDGKLFDDQLAEGLILARNELQK